jgi:hypothetical protein
MINRIVVTIILALTVWYIVVTLEGRPFGNALLAGLMVICTSVIIYKIDKLREEINNHKDEE